MSLAILPKTVGLTLVSLAFFTTTYQAASAATVTRNFIATVTDGSYAGQSGTGSFTYDDTNIPSDDITPLTPIQGLSLTFSFLGQSYTANDDIDYPNSPQLFFAGQNPFFLQYLVSTNNLPGITSLGIFDSLTDNGNGTLETTLVVTEAASVIPEPSSVLAILGLGFFGVGSIFKNNKRLQ